MLAPQLRHLALSPLLLLRHADVPDLLRGPEAVGVGLAVEVESAESARNVQLPIHLTHALADQRDELAPVPVVKKLPDMLA